MTNNPFWRYVFSYIICFVLLLVLIETTWGITTGIIGGLKIGRDKEFQEEISNILKDSGIKEIDIPKSNDNWYEEVPPEVKRDVRDAIKRKLQDINWFGTTLAVSSFVFAIVGFLCGFINRAFIPVGIVVVLSFLVNNPVVRFPHAKALGSLQKVVVVLAQFGICYLFGYLGALLGMRRYNRRLKARSIGN